MAKSKSANTYIDFFSGCGGLSLGLGWAGWQGVFAIEKDPMAYTTFDKNLIAADAPHRHFENWPSWLSKEPHTIEDVLQSEDMVENLKKMAGQVTLVAGGPPCQGFSVAGARNGNDPRNLLVFKQIEAIKLLEPIYAIIENVGGFERKFVSKPIDGMTMSVAEEAIKQLEALGYNVGKSIISEEHILFCKNMLDKYQDKIVLPKDFITEKGNMIENKLIDHFDNDDIGYDIGSKTVREFNKILSSAKRVILNGPMGMFEEGRFSNGTLMILRQLSEIKAKTVVGGGDTASAVNKLGFANKFYHVSTGGGATMKYLEDSKLIGIEVISDEEK